MLSLRNFAAFLMASCLLACSGPHIEWSEADRENIRHYFTSAEASRAATAYTNDPNIPFDENEYLSICRLALDEAKLVDDLVLAKAHPDMPERFRALYQESLVLMIHAVENRDNQASVNASSLHDQWVDWYNANRGKIKIPN